MPQPPDASAALLHDEAAPQALIDAFGRPREAAFPPDLHDAHHLRLKALLLTVWVVFSFGITYFARDIQALFPHQPAAYWMAAQGSVLVFLIIIVVYCLAMDHFERAARKQPLNSAASADSSPSLNPPINPVAEAGWADGQPGAKPTDSAAPHA